MPESVNLVKAELQEIDLTEKDPEPKLKVPVQFNPETLKVSFANSVQTPEGGAGDQRGGAAQQFVGAGTTKLALQLWFDVNAPQQGETIRDVRKLTEKISYFITPKETPKGSKKYLPPGVRFIWGSFQFDGIMESLEESLEYFSDEGVPLRASVSLSLTQQKIDVYKYPDDAPTNQPLPLPGTRELTPVAEGETMQGAASKAGKGGDWQSMAAANGIENPRLIPPGTLLDPAAKNGGLGGGVPLMNDAGVPAEFLPGGEFELE